MIQLKDKKHQSDLFAREDESDDSAFYAFPRFVTHIDDETIAAITRYYQETLHPGDRILDLMSSWISHLPDVSNDYHVSGLGMNRLELEKNPQLSEIRVQDLNKNPELPWDSTSFDKVLIAVSVQYLIHPYDVFREIGRVLKPGGQCIVCLSHRLFPTKAIKAFHTLSAGERCGMVADYMNSGAGLTDIQILDRSPHNADPLWIVTGFRSPDSHQSTTKGDSI